jgi:putative tricarboxylic transport membrane protein
VELVIVLIPLSLLFSYGAIKLGIGSVAAPGPGFYPLLLGIGVLLLSAALLFQGRRREVVFALFSLSPEERKTRLKVVAFVSGILLYPLGLKYFGYIPSGIALLLYLFFLSGLKNVISGLILASGFIVVIYLLFVVFLEVPLP